MSINNCLILSAGLGTRMGQVGKILPKPLWPLFEKSLIEVQIEFINQYYNPKNIFINIFHQSELFHEYLIKLKSKYNNLNIVIEKNLLGVGGSIYNIAKELNYEGNLLIINSDQFLFHESINDISCDDIVLLGMPVNKDENYSFIELDQENHILDIRKKNCNDQYYFTYSGNGLINLSRIEKIKDSDIKFMNFFETIANYKIKKVKLLNVKSPNYYDFGNKFLYSKLIFECLDKIINKKQHCVLVDFLIKNNFLNLEKISSKTFSYGRTKSYNVINFSNFHIDKNCIDDKSSRSIIINSNQSTIIQIEKSTTQLYFNGTLDSLPH